MLPAVFDQCQWLSRHFESYVESSVFLTPPNSGCFSMHYDIIDVLMIQVVGSKIMERHVTVNPCPVTSTALEV